MVPGMTEREGFAADQRRRAWLAAARSEPASRAGPPRRGRTGVAALRWAGETFRQFQERRRATPAVDAPATPSPPSAPQSGPTPARP